MTLKEMISDLQIRLRDMGGTFREAELAHWLNEGQIDFARRTLCLASKAETLTIKGEAHYTLPNDMIQPQAVRYDGNIITPIALSECDETEGAPAHYALLGVRTIVLSPVPAESKKLQIHYYEVPDKMVNPTDVSGLPTWAHEAVVIYAAIRAFEAMPNATEMQRATADRLRSDYSSLLNEQYSRLRRKHPSQWRWERSASG